MSFVGAAAKKNPQEGDVQFPLNAPNNPTDSISSICCNGFGNSPTNILIATSWDCTVTCFEIQNMNNRVSIQNRGQIRHDAPVLCSDIASDNVTAFSGGCDGAVKMWNVTQGPGAAQVVGTHEQPVKCLKFMPETNTVITGSWDKTVKVWDMRQPQPVVTIPMNERVYCMDAKGQAVVGNIDNQRFTEITDTNNNKGFAMGCIEGRVAVEYFDELQYKNQTQTTAMHKPKSENFVFKCHRFKLANLEAYKRVCPITDVKFNEQGTYLFYSMSYDWSRGAENNDAKFGQNIYLHQVQPAEITPKDKSTLGKK
eukprot:gene26869-35561_t